MIYTNFLFDEPFSRNMMKFGLYVT